MSNGVPSHWAATALAADVLRQGRWRLVGRTQVRTSSLFETLYDYDESPAFRSLLFEREAVAFIDDHVNLIRDAVTRTADGRPEGQEARNAEGLLLEVQVRLLKQILGLSKLSAVTTSLLSDYQALLTRLINNAVRNQTDYEALLASGSLHRALYRRARQKAERR